MRLDGRTLRNLMGAAVAALLLLPACTAPNPDAGHGRFVLERFQGCQELEGYVEDVAVHEMERIVDGDYGYGYGGLAEGDATRGAEGAPSAGDSATSGGASTPSASGTNDQEQGVDEPDFLKNDDETILLLAGGSLVAVDAFPAAETHELSRTAIEGSPIALVRRGSKVAVLSSAPAPASIARGPSAGGGGWGGSGGGATREAAPCAFDGPCDGGYVEQATKVTILDVSDLGAPTVDREIYLEGSYAAGRLVGDTLLLVNAATPAGPALQLWAETPLDRARLKLENTATIRAQEIDAWLPRFADRRGGGETVGTIGGCEGFYRPATEQGRSILSLASIRLDQASSGFEAASIVGQPGTVYASREALYVASYLPWYGFNWQADAAPEEISVLHKFDITGPTPLYVATGEIDGHVLNQFSMDEQEGVLRAATTTEGWTVDGSAITPKNHVFTLQERAGALEVLGSVRDLAPGERIQSARFFEDQGFVVTFRQVDPLFAIDLADQAAPAVRGELHTTGFSQYLHPFEGGKLLALGQEADGSGRVSGLALSLFDVADLSRPTLLHRASLGPAYSEAQGDHHAFNFFPPRGVLALPLTDWDTGFSGLEVWGVSAQGFSLRGRVDHGSFTATDPSAPTYAWTPQVRRSVIIGSALYSVSDLGLKVSSLDDLSIELAALALPPPPYQTYGGGGGGVVVVDPAAAE